MLSEAVNPKILLTKFPFGFKVKGEFLVIIISLVTGIGFLYFPPLWVLAAIGIALFMVILFYYPFVGVVTYLIVEYARIPAMFPSLQPLQIGKLVVVPTLLIWLFKSVSARRLDLVKTPLNWVMLSWLALIFLSSFFAQNSNAALNGAIDFAKWAVIFFLIVNLTDTFPKWQAFLWILILLNFKMSQFQLREFAAGYQMTQDTGYFIARGVGAGSTAFFANASDFGVAMCVVIPLAFFLIKSVRPKLLRSVAFVIFAFFTLSILTCGSRGAAVALVMMALVYWIKSPKKILTGILIGIFVFSFWSLSSQPWRERLFSGFRYKEDATASIRLNLWEAGIDMTLKHPLMGVGMNNFPFQYADQYSSQERKIFWAPHNIFIQASSELGVGGLLCLIFCLFHIFKENRKTRRLSQDTKFAQKRHLWENEGIVNFSCALDLSLVGYIISGLFLTVLYYPHLYILMAMSVSLRHALLGSMNSVS
jgi:putative inorganic carbon (HCO3(-)) transporter